MAASTQQKVDFLLKKIGYTASKTGLAEDSSLSGTKKAPFAEAVPSPLVIATSSVWADSEYIPGTPPGSSSSYVQVYLSGTSGHQMTVDSTVSGNRSYIAYSTYNNSSTAILGDWIDTQFGSSYIIKVYKGDPNSGGVSLSAAGSGSSDGWFFDYSSGILNFNDTNVPSGVTDSNIYVVGYRYIGGKGVLAPAGIGTFNSLEVSGVSTFSAAVDANAGADISGGIGLNVVGHTELDEVNVSGVSTYGGAIDANAGVLASTLKVEDLTATRVVLAGTGGEIEDNAKLTFTTDKLAVTGGLTVSAGATFAGIVDGNAGANISGGEATFASATVSDLTDNRVVIAGTSGALEDSGNLTFSGTKLTVTGNAQVTTDLDVDGGANISGGVGLNVVGHTELDEVNVSGVSTYGGAIDANAGIDVSGHTELDNVNVSGVATYSAAADFNAGADISGGVGLNVVGHTELDEVNVSGVSTFAGLVDGNAGANFSGAETILSSATVSDLTNNRVVLAGTAGSLEDSSSITFDGSNLAIVGGATFTGNVTIGGTLTSEDKTNVDSVGLITARTGVRITSGGLIVSAGVNTFTDAIDANGGANISGGAGLVASSAKISDLTSGRVVVAGTDGELEDASTFTVSGGTVSATAFSATNLTGTLQTAAQPNVTSLGTIANLVASRAQVTGVGGLVITGVSTFTGAVDANGGADISGGVGLNVVGHAELDEVNVSGVSTYAGAIDANAGAHISGGIGLEVVGHTEVDNFSASGVSTFAALVDGNAGANFSGAETVLSSATVSDLTENRIVIAGADGALEDASTLTFDGTKVQVGSAITMYQATGIVSATYFYGDGSNLLNAGSTLSAASAVQRVVTTSLTSGTMTTAGTDADLTFDTSSNTLNAGKVNVAGVGTFGGLIDGNAGATITGAETTLSSATVSDLTDERVVLAGSSGALEDSGNLTFNGTKLTVTGNAQVTTDLDVDGGANISGGVGLNVVGHTELDEVNISGVSTYGGAADFNAGVLANTLKVEDLSGARVVVSGTGGEIEDSANLTWVSNGANYLGLTGGLTVSAASTFSGAIDGNGGADISGGETTLSSATVSDLTSGRVVVAGTSGALEDASTFTFSGGTVSATAFSATDLTGTLQTAAQTNVTSLGTLTGLAVNGDLALHGPAGVSSVTWDKSDNALEFLDHAKATFGTGNDLQIYHEPTNSRNRIDSRNGNISLRAEDSITFESQDSDGNNQVNLAKFLEAGACELYYSGSKKIETTFTGAIVSGMATATGGFSGDITGVGATFTNVTGTLQTAAQTNITSVGTLGGLTITGGNLVITDSSKITMGSGNVMQMNHFGGNTFLEHTSASGAFYIQGDDLRLTNKDRDETYIECDDEAGVILNYTSSKKFETTHSGAIVTGVLTATTFSGSGASLDTLNASELDSGTIPSARYGTGNTFVKLRSASAASDSGTNTFAGNGSGAALDGSSGDHNTFYGRSAGGANDTGSNNAFYGSNAGVSNVTGSNLVCVGYQADATNTSTSNEVTLGNDSITKFRVPGIGLTFTSSGVGILTATQHFSGDIVGVGATFTNVTGTLQTAAQPNITSLGTIASLVASTAKVSDLTVNRVVTVGASGELQDSANLTYNGVNLGVNGINVTGNILAPNAGNFVAIGTANALGAGTDRLAVHGSGTDSGVRIWCSASAHKATAVPLQVADTSGTEFFRVHADGKVGIGTDNPNWNLTVQGSSGTTTIASKNTGGNASVYIEASNGNTAKLELAEAGTGSYSLQVGDDNALMIFDDSTERLRITSAGRTLIGTGAVSASSNLVAQGGLQVSANGASGAPSLCVGADGTGANTQSLTDNTVKDCRIGYPNYDIDEEPLALMSGFVGDGSSLDDNDGARIYIGGGTSYLNAVNQVRFYTQNTNITTVTGTERFRIGPDGTADFQSNTVQKAVLKNYTETIKAIGNTGTSTTLDLADGNVFTATLNGNCTFTFTTGTNSAPNMQSFSLLLTNDGSAGRTIAWPASVKWPNASIPSRTTAASKTDIWSFMSPDNGTTWYGNIALYNFS